MADGNGKWQIGFWVIAVLVVGSFTWTTQCYLCNQGRIETTLVRLADLKDVANDSLHKIDLRLLRIESKLAIDNVK